MMTLLMVLFVVLFALTLLNMRLLKTDVHY